MKSHLILIFGIFGFCLNAFAADLPVASDIDFKEGMMWEWSYRNSEGEIYSVERYKLIDIKTFQLNTTLRFELSTSYNGGAFDVHHQFTVNLRQCYRSHLNPRQRYGFNLRMYPVREGRVERYVIAPSIAFEEKFNCNGIIYENNWRYETNFGTVVNPILGERAVFYQKDKIRKGAQLTGAYDAQTGIMLKKVFNPGTDNEYTSELTDLISY